MTQTDAQHRHSLDQLPRHRDGRLQLRRVTRAVREHDRVRAAGEDGLEVAVVREDVDLHAARAQRSQDVSLDAIVDDDEPQAGPLAHRPGRQCRIEGFHDIAESLRDLAYQVLFLEWGDAVDSLAQRWEFVARPDDGPLRARAS